MSAERTTETAAITHGLAEALGGLIRDQLRSIEQRHQTYREQAEALIADLRARVSHVESLAERASRKGYDLDPDEVLAVVSSPGATS